MSQRLSTWHWQKRLASPSPSLRACILSHLQDPILDHPCKLPCVQLLILNGCSHVGKLCVQHASCTSLTTTNYWTQERPFPTMTYLRLGCSLKDQRKAANQSLIQTHLWLWHRDHQFWNVQKLSVYNISHKLLRPSQFLEKFMKILEWSTLQK